MPETPESTDERRHYPRRFSSQHGDYARLLREYKAFEIELELLAQMTSKGKEPWVTAARKQLDQVQRFLGKENGENNRKGGWLRFFRNRNKIVDIEGGWVCLNAAKRYVIYGLGEPGLSLQASMLKEEAEKITGWRNKAIVKQLNVTDDNLR